LTLAFLNSFRAFNPSIPPCFIPYNDACSRIWALREKYQFDLFEDTDLKKWAGIREGWVRKGKLKGLSRPVFLVHWAGLWRPRKLDLVLQHLLQALRIVPASSKLQVRRRMPDQKLWRYYRNLRAS